VSPGLVVVPDARALARRAAERILELVRAAVAERGCCSVALAGGSTPRATYEVLGGSALASALPWGAVDWYFGDERAVPPDHAESNYRAAVETLFASRPEALARVHRMPGDAADLEAAARAYGDGLPERLDLMLLGIGEDGHTASLFPGSTALAERAARIAVVTGPKPPNPRLTVTPPVIESARQLLVLASGEGKAAAVARALEGPPDVVAVPAQLVRAAAWLVDRDAGRLLARTALRRPD
jgi:6-phosphogluconolactonase